MASPRGGGAFLDADPDEPDADLDAAPEARGMEALPADVLIACTYVHVYCLIVYTLLSRREARADAVCVTKRAAWPVGACPPSAWRAPSLLCALPHPLGSRAPPSLPHPRTLSPPRPRHPSILPPSHPPSHHSRYFWAQNLAGKKRSPSTNETRVIQRDILTETTVTTTRGPLPRRRHIDRHPRGSTRAGYSAARTFAPV